MHPPPIVVVVVDDVVVVVVVVVVIVVVVVVTTLNPFAIAAPPKPTSISALKPTKLGSILMISVCASSKWNNTLVPDTGVNGSVGVATLLPVYPNSEAIPHFLTIL